MKRISILLAALLIMATLSGCGSGGSGGSGDSGENGEKEMKIIDLTHMMTEGMPVFPGDDGPTFQKVTTHEEDGYMMTHISTWSHVGTHMDSPAHIIAGTKTLDEFPIEKFVGRAYVIDCTDLEEGQEITISYIDKDRDKADKAEFILFCLGWDKYWGTDRYYGDFPIIDDEVAQYLIESGKKGVGYDVISPDPIESEELEVHNALLEHEIVILENLANLNLCGDDLFTLYALPLYYENSDGAQIRAIAVLEK